MNRKLTFLGSITNSGAMDTHNGSRTYTNMNSSETLVDIPIPLLRDTLKNMRWDYIGIRMINSLIIIPMIVISVLFFFSFTYLVSHAIYSKSIRSDVGGYVIPRGPKEYLSLEGGANPNLNHHVPRHTIECTRAMPLLPRLLRVLLEHSQSTPSSM